MDKMNEKTIVQVVTDLLIVSLEHEAKIHKLYADSLDRLLRLDGEQLKKELRAMCKYSALAHVEAEETLHNTREKYQS